jgi:hypothetical protein
MVRRASPPNLPDGKSVLTFLNEVHGEIDRLSGLEGREGFARVTEPMRFMCDRLGRGRAPSEIVGPVRRGGCPARAQGTVHLRLRAKWSTVMGRSGNLILIG